MSGKKAKNQIIMTADSINTERKVKRVTTKNTGNKRLFFFEFLFFLLCSMLNGEKCTKFTNEQIVIYSASKVQWVFFKWFFFLRFKLIVNPEQKKNMFSIVNQSKQNISQYYALNLTDIIAWNFIRVLKARKKARKVITTKKITKANMKRRKVTRKSITMNLGIVFNDFR